MHSTTSFGYRPYQTIIQQLYPIISKFVSLRVCRVNVGTPTEIVQEKLHRCRIRARHLIWRISVRIIKGKSPQYKLLRIESSKSLGLGIFLAGKWIDKVIYISKVNDEMIFIKVLFQAITLIIPVQVPYRELNDSQGVLSGLLFLS